MKNDKEKTLSGKFFLHVRGFGFVHPDCGHEEIFVPKGKNKNALSGDIVLLKGISKSKKGYEGVVDKVLKRENEDFLAYVIDENKDNYILFSPLIGENTEVLINKNRRFSIGDIVLVKIDSFDAVSLPASLLSFIGNISDASLDVSSAIIEHRIRNTFPESVIDEARKFTISEKDYKNRVDLREIETVTIDPTTAKDFDDAISLSKEKNGNFLLGIHIADVSHFVKDGSKLDNEAYLRANSTYFPSKVVPMLPENLSNNLCSLVEKKDRLTVSVLLEVDPTGKIIDKELVKSVICSDKRFTYDEAFAILSTKKKHKHREILENMQELCHIFKKLRSKRGSVELNLPDTQVICDDKENPTHIEKHLYDITHQMIEEFMLKANEIVAETLIERNKGGLYRIHDEPDHTTLENFYTFIRLLGYSINNNATASDIAKLFQQAKDHPHIEQLAVKYIRSQKLAAYSPTNIGHYGLALENYSHFTSPIRRYSDLVVHRVLFDKPYNDEQLEAFAKKCSEQERKSFVAETSVVKRKKYRLLDRFFEEDVEKIYNGVITNITLRGITFDVENLGIDGNVSMRNLHDDYYEFNEKRMQLKGRHTGFTYTLGDHINMQLVAIDLVFLEAAWELV